jgi:hypothetical protein
MPDEITAGPDSTSWPWGSVFNAGSRLWWGDPLAALVIVSCEAGAAKAVLLPARLAVGTAESL